MIRVLFVDDDALVLAGLKRLFRRLAGELQTEFAASGQEALQRLAHEPFDAIVSDMRMPGMDGAQLLTRVQADFPHMVRLILSGQAPNESKFRALGPAHQFLAKPCQPDELRGLLTRALRIRDRFANPELQALIGRIETLPSVPRIYSELIDELHSPHGSIDRVSQIVAQDVAMTAKILHLVNSSFFGIPVHISSLSQAVCLLGIELVKSLVLTVGVFSQFHEGENGFNIEQFSQHAISVGETAHRLAKRLEAPAQDANEALLAGMMHDVGKLVLTTERSDEYSKAQQLATDTSRPMWQVEESYFGASHADIGAFLLSLWGLPNPIVEAVAFHHQPSKVEDAMPVVLTAVHVANALVNEQQLTAGHANADEIVDSAYIAAAGIDVDVHSLLDASSRRDCLSRPTV
ncbi:MAG: HDOD domain-containing protein [Planctomycetes bacterium]|nr:HDOD domain-containing protein [Planctomycetota bacterium]